MPQLSFPTLEDTKLLSRLRKNLTTLFHYSSMEDAIPNWAPCSASYTSPSVIRLILIPKLIWPKGFIPVESSVKKFTTVSAPQVSYNLRDPGHHICSAISPKTRLLGQKVSIYLPTPYQILSTASMAWHHYMVNERHNQISSHNIMLCDFSAGHARI